MIPTIILFSASLIFITLLIRYYYRKNNDVEEFQSGTQEMPVIPQPPSPPPPPPLVPGKSMPFLPGASGMAAADGKCNDKDDANSKVSANTINTAAATVENDPEVVEEENNASMLESLINQFENKSNTNITVNNVSLASVLYNMHFNNTEIQTILNSSTIDVKMLNELKQEINSNMVLVSPGSSRGKTLRDILGNIEKLELKISSTPASELDKMYVGIGHGVEDLEKCADLADSLNLKQNTYSKEEVDTIRDQLKQEIMDEIGRSRLATGTTGTSSYRYHENPKVQEKISDSNNCKVHPVLSHGSAINVHDYTKVGSIMPEFVYYETQ